MKRQRDYSDDYHSILSQFPEEFDAALNYAKKLKAWFQYDQPEEKINSFSRILEDAMVTSAADDGSVGRPTAVPEYFSARVKRILVGNRNLICGFNSLMPPLYQIGLDDAEKKETEAAMERKTFGDREILDFVKKLSIKCGQDGCGELLKIFRLYKKGSRSLDDVCDFGRRLTEGHPGLQQDFLNLMPTTEETPSASCLPDLQSSELANCRVDEQQKKSPEIFEVSKKNSDLKAVGSEAKGSESVTEKIREGLGFLEKVKKRLPCEIIYKNLLKLFFYYTKGKIGKAELKRMVADLIGKYPDLIDEFYNFWRNYDGVDVLEERGCKERDRRREKHGNKSRIRDCSVKHKNGKDLFECEDERYELDMLLQWFKSANIYAAEMEGCTVEKNGSERIFLRCIDRLYGDQGVEVLDIFHKDPQRVLPVLRMRLQQKLAELMQYLQSLKWY